MKLHRFVFVSLLSLFVQSFFGSMQVTAQQKSFALITNERLTLGTEKNRSASVRLGDLDGDGDLDAVVANGRHWTQQNFAFFNQGRARFSVMRPLGKDRSTTYACELADLDGDGDLDIAIGNDMAMGEILLNDGTGRFESHGKFGEVASVRSLTIADMDGDGDKDILATCRGMQNRIYLNQGSADFKSGPTFGTKSDSTIDVAVGDVNQDGNPDLILANRDGQQNFVLLNDGKLGFKERRPFGTGRDQSRAVAVGDVNGDGKLDWVIGNIGQSNALFLGDGKGGVEKTIEFGNEKNRTYTVAIADMDSDGDLDIVTGNAGQPNFVYLNEGDATGFIGASFGGSQATYGLSVGDLDGNDLPEVAVANSDGLNFVYLNRIRKQSGPAKRSQMPAKPQQNSNLSSATPTTNWPAFRGTGARGVADGFPIRSEWNADKTVGEVQGVLWQKDVPGLGHSSPVVFDDRIYLLTAVAKSGDAPLKVEAGGKPTAADDNGVQVWLVVCYDKHKGNELLRKTVFRGKPRATRHAKATHANTSVCVDGKHVLAFLGSEGLHCFDLNGKLLWSRDLGVINISKYGIGWGFASSPSLHGEKIAIVCDDPNGPFVAALRLKDGKELWRASRKGICERSWGTPLIHEGKESTQIVVNGWPWIMSYDLDSGRELWRIKGGGDNPVPTPFVANGWFYITNAHGGPSPIFVIRPEARGVLEVVESGRDSEETAVVWSVAKGGSYMSTPVVYGDYLYLGNSNGVVRCFHAKTGKKIYEQRLGRGAGVIASLVAADGKIFCASENGTVYVLAGGPEFKVLSESPMGEPCLATPAISAGVMYFRTTRRLIAIK